MDQALMLSKIGGFIDAIVDVVAEQVLYRIEQSERFATTARVNAINSNLGEAWKHIQQLKGKEGVGVDDVLQTQAAQIQNLIDRVDELEKCARSLQLIVDRVDNHRAGDRRLLEDHLAAEKEQLDIDSIVDEVLNHSEFDDKVVHVARNCINDATVTIDDFSASIRA